MPTDSMLSTPPPSRSSSMSAATNCAPSSRARFTYGAAAGAVAGVALALLFAPMRGTAMRARVRRYAAQSSGKVQDLLASGRSRAENALNRSAYAIEESRRAFRTSGYASPEPLTASLAEISGVARGYEEPLGG